MLSVELGKSYFVRHRILLETWLVAQLRYGKLTIDGADWVTTYDTQQEI